MVPVALGVKSTEQVTLAPPPLSVQLVLVGETPAPLAVRLTVPVAGTFPVSGSCTVTVQVVG
jgi:hypothetical protein